MAIEISNESTAGLTLDAVFNELAAAVRAKSADGRVLYGAQAKKLLTSAYPGFSERAFGFTKFIELLVAGAKQEKFNVQTIGGHPRLTTFDPAHVTAVAIPRDPALRIRPDLWDTILTWEAGDRYWDRTRKRAIYVPTDAEGGAAWLSSPESFVEVPPVAMEVQLEWMASFSEEQEKDARSKLKSALDDGIPGAFRRELGKFGLHAAWKSRLQSMVSDYAQKWAEANGIPVSSIAVARHKSPAIDYARGKAPTAPPSKLTTPDDSLVAELRSRLHEVIDQMSLADLAALPVPSIYLLHR